MNLLHISDMHFGPYHWAANDAVLLERLNAFDADIVLNTGDMTTDSLEDEFRQAGEFLSKLRCDNVVSINGNHDKFSRRAQEMFRKYIYNTEFVKPADAGAATKSKLFVNPGTANLDEYLTDLNYTREIKVNGEKLLFVCLDTNVFQRHDGFVDLEILDALSRKITTLTYDRILMLAHHSVLTTDEHPLLNSRRVTDFMLKHRIEATFCGHTHELDILGVSDLARGGNFRQFMCGSLASVNVGRDKNMFCTYENFGKKNEIIKVTKMTPTAGGLEFSETVLGA